MKIKFHLLSIFVSLALLACTRSGNQVEKGDMPIILLPTFENSTASRATATAFEVGDEIGLYVLRSVENAKFTVAADGSITSSPAIYYPDPKQPVAFRAYYPYNSSVTDATKIPFSVTTDLKQSDLCYAQAEALPSKEAQALPFKHWLSRVFVNVTLNSKVKSIKSVKLINTATDLTLNIETGAITLNSQSKSLLVNNSEAIVPPQTFAASKKMLEITVETIAGATETYYYTPLSSMTLERGKAHSFSLALNDDQSVTLTASPQIAPWTGGASTGEVDQKISNRLILHWVSEHSRAAEVDKITLTLKDNNGKITQHTINKPQYSNSSFSFDFAPDGFIYPYTITKIDFHQSTNILQSCADLLAISVYKSGDHAIGVKDIGNAVKIGNLWWATGNLVATKSGGCAPGSGAKIGDPLDGGIYFKFGSLIGYKGGNQSNGGNGVGIMQPPRDNVYWGGSSIEYPGFNYDTYIWPSTMTNKPTGWVQNTVPGTSRNMFFFSLNTSPYYNRGQDLKSYSGFTSNALANVGVGDPCRYYLANGWRLPTVYEFGDLACNVYPNGGPWSGMAVNWGYGAATKTYINETGNIPEVYFNTKATSLAQVKADPYAILFISAGYRQSGTGLIMGVGSTVGYCTSSVAGEISGFYMSFSAGGGLYPHGNANYNRDVAYLARCVKDV